MSWALHRYIVEPFPLEGPPKLMLRAFEGFFDVYTLLELVGMFFWPYSTRGQFWAQLKSRFSRKGRRGSRRPRKT
jgi:hypothetical protein